MSSAVAIHKANLLVEAIRVARIKDNTLLHKIADAHHHRVKIAVRFAFAKGRMELGNPPNAKRAAFAVGYALRSLLPQALDRARVEAGRAVGNALPRVRHAEIHVAASKFRIDFNGDNEAAIEWARDHVGEMIDDIEDTTREAIQEAIVGMLEGDDTFDDILDAIGDDDRAERIARTELMSAVNEGQREAWGQAQDEGLLPEDMVRVWIAAGDACPECDALDGETAEMDGEYPNDGGDGPPLHPNCWCTEGLIDG